MSGSKIEWTGETWGPVTGCSKTSPGCAHCYAETLLNRFQKSTPKFRNGFEVTLHEDALSEPSKRKKPTLYFVCSMADLFHKDVPDTFIQRVFDVMRDNRRHTFQVLTKRSDRMLSMTQAGVIEWPPNVWAGVSVENQEMANKRISDLMVVEAETRFLSIEPLLSRVDLRDLFIRLGGWPTWGKFIHWVIVGGESGPGARPMKAEWVVDIQDQCGKADVRFFFKQWGGVNKKAAGRLLQGRVWDEMPEVAK